MSSRPESRQIGWMSRHGIRLPEPDGDGIMICPESGYRYKEVEPGVVRCLDLDEDSPLPPDKAICRISYDQFKKK
jgi:UDP-2-acetamido-3-amino-2,3-dideoxy-glucuronate N-acetyltransferase